MASQPAPLLTDDCDTLADSVAAGAWLDRLSWPRDREAVAVVLLDREMAPIRTEWVGRGKRTSATFLVRSLAAVTLLSGAHAVVLAHNHPSGCSHPSHADRHLTGELARVLAALDVVLVDHLILGRNGWRSMRDSGLL